MRHYRLADDRKTPIPVDDVKDWGEWFETERGDPHIENGHTTIDNAEVSTVFLSMDHSWGTGPPILWETMVFGGSLNGVCVRYTSYEQAVGGHEAMCEAVRGAEPYEGRPEYVAVAGGRRSIALHGRLTD